VTHIPTIAAFLEFTFLHVRDCTYFAFDRQVLPGPNRLRILYRVLLTSSSLAYNLFELCSCMIMMSTGVKASDAAMNFIYFLNCIIQEIFANSHLQEAKKHPDLYGASRPKEFHLQPLPKPDVSLSTHPAPIIQPSGNTPRRQWTNKSGWECAKRSRNLRARLLCRKNRLNFLHTQRIRYRLMLFQILPSAEG
jgi:hypothetical protein